MGARRAQPERAAEKERRAEEARRAWEAHLHKIHAESAKTARLRAARLAKESEDEALRECGVQVTTEDAKTV